MATHSSILVWETLWTEEPGSHGVTKSQTQLKQLNTAHITHLDCPYIPKSTQVYSVNFKCHSNPFIIKVVCLFVCFSKS